jgi:hypothetical protein
MIVVVRSKAQVLFPFDPWSPASVSKPKSSSRSNRKDPSMTGKFLRIKRLPIICITATICILAAGHDASGTSVLSVAFGELVEKSEFIFEGKAVSLETRNSPINGFPETCVLFQVLDILKGNPGPNSMELCFSGGSTGAYSLHVSEMRYPEKDEKGIYFVESLSRDQIHPFYGWSQGHFLVEKRPEASDEVVLTADKRPVSEIAHGVEPATGISTGIAGGVMTLSRSNKTGGMSVESFKQRILEEKGSAR